MEFLSESLRETAEIAKNFAEKIKPEKNSAAVIGLYGELGSGKTTFMKYLAENFGVKETIQSPTFVIMKIYKILSIIGINSNADIGMFEHLIHIDCYRIEKEEEMVNLGWGEMVSNPKNLICVEWPERIVKIMPKHIIIKFEHVGENQRKISIA